MFTTLNSLFITLRKENENGLIVTYVRYANKGESILKYIELLAYPADVSRPENS